MPDGLRWVTAARRVARGSRRCSSTSPKVTTSNCSTLEGLPEAGRGVDLADDHLLGPLLGHRQPSRDRVRSRPPRHPCSVSALVKYPEGAPNLRDALVVADEIQGRCACTSFSACRIDCYLIDGCQRVSLSVSTDVPWNYICGQNHFMTWGVMIRAPVPALSVPGPVPAAPSTPPASAHRAAPDRGRPLLGGFGGQDQAEAAQALVGPTSVNSICSVKRKKRCKG